MKLFPKKELNSYFLNLIKQALRKSAFGWKGGGQLHGFALDEDLFFILKLQQSTSPTKAGFRAITGVGSKRLKKRESGKDCRLPDPHLRTYYVPASQPDNLGAPGESWMIITKAEHAPSQAESLIEHVEREARMAINETWTAAKFFDRMRTHGNPYEFGLLIEIST